MGESRGEPGSIMADTQNVLQRLPGFDALMQETPEMSEAVLSDPAIQALLGRLQTSPEQIHAQREAQRLGSGQKGVKAKLKGILGILEAAGSGFVGQPSIGDRSRTQAYEEYKTMAPYLERQLEAGIRNRAAIEKNRTELLKTAAKYSVDSEKAFQAGQLSQGQLDQIRANIGRIGAMKDLAQQRTEMAKLETQLYGNYGTKTLPGNVVSGLAASGENLEGGKIVNPNRYLQGVESNAMAQGMPRIMQSLLGGRSAGGGNTRVTSSEKILQVPTGEFTKELRRIPTTTVTQTGGGAPTDPVSTELRQGFLNKGLDFLKRGGTTPAPITSADTTPSPQQVKQISRAAPKSGVPALPAPVVQQIAQQKGAPKPTAPKPLTSEKTAPGSPGIFYTPEYFKRKAAVTDAKQRTIAVMGLLNDHIFDPEEPSFFGRYLGGNVGAGAVWNQDLRSLRRKNSSGQVALDSAMFDQAWKYVKEMSGLAVTQAEWDTLEKILPTTARNVESAWMRSAVFTLMADLARLRMALPEEKDRKAVGLDDGALIYNINNYMRELYDGNPGRGIKGVKADVIDTHKSGKQNKDLSRYYMSQLSLAEVLKRFYPDKHKALVERLPDEGGVNTTIRIPKGPR